MARLGGFRLHAVDRPAFGLTPAVKHRTETLRRLAVDFLEQVLDGLGLESALFLANSIGSLWTFWLALDRPGRVAGMTHVGCPALLLGTSAPFFLRLLSVRPVGKLMTTLSPPSPKGVDQFASMIGEDLSGLDELRDLLVATQKLPDARHAMLDLVHSVVRLTGAQGELVLWPRDLAEVSQPTQFIWGPDDGFGSPDVGRRAARIMRDAEFHLLDEGGHIPWGAHSEEVAELARPFLRKCAQQAGYRAESLPAEVAE
jgi:pimeloyl-ACP methyl ester carboxylesterase